MATLNIEVQARTDAAVRNLKNLTDGAADIGKKFNDDAAGALGVFGVSLTKLDQPLTLVAESLKQSIDAAAKWGDSMGDLAQMTGASVHDTSKLAATFELVGVSTGTLEQAIKSMTKNGLALNIDTLKTLAGKYQALQDPVAKNEFLFKNFGKAGMEMAEIMGRSAGELDKLSASALRSGKVISEDAAGAAEEFNTNMAIMQQRIEGAQIALGNALIPTLNAAVTSFDQLWTIGQILDVNFLEMIGVMDSTTAQAERMRAAGIEPVTTSTATMTVGISEATAALKDETFAFEDNRISADLVSQSFSALTAQMLYNKAAAGLSGEAALELARGMGLVNEKSYGALTALADLRTKYDTNHDGAISAAEGAAQYTAEVLKLKGALDSIPAQVNSVVTVTTQGDIGQVITGGNGGGAQITQRRAGGGPVYGGTPYIVGENGPELFVPTQSGQILSNSMTMNVGGISINGAGNPGAVAAAVRAELDRMGRQTDTRLRTR